MINVAELAYMRTAAEEAMHDTCTIQYVSSVADDGQGGETPTWSNRATGVKCRASVGGLTPQERTIANRLGNQTVWTVTLPAGQTITTKDRITVTLATSPGGPVLTFEVVAIGVRSEELTRRTVCVEVS